MLKSEVIRLGMVNESRNSPSVLLSSRAINAQTGAVFSTRSIGYHENLTESQLGYRSGPLGAEELKSIEYLDKTGHWAKQADMLQALDRIQQATSPTPRFVGTVWAVHPRTYHSFRSDAVHATCEGWVTTPNATYIGEGAAYVVDLTYVPPPRPSDAALAGEAGSTMRNFRPVRPDTNLARFIGELRDAPHMANLANYLPGKYSQVGGAYLNAQFGIMPTASDLHKMAESVLKADKLTKQFVRDSAQLVRRHARKSIENVSVNGTGTTNGGQGLYTGGGITFRADHGLPGITYLGPTYNSYLNFQSEIRTFSTFEYFVGDPGGYTSRMDSYTRRAQKLLGIKLDESTIYALTPWTWLADWFVDIGGLLDYQQSVADYSLVQRAGGFVYEETTRGSIEFQGSRNIITRSYTGTPWGINAVERYQSRKSGSPYSMSPTWSLNGFQWSILGAMGMTRAPGVARILG